MLIFPKNIFFRFDVKTSPKMDGSENFVNADKLSVKICVSSREYIRENIYEKVLKQFWIPHFNKVEFQHGKNTKILRLRQKMMNAWSL